MEPRAILHVDMDAFYAAVEQRDHPEWRGLPLIVGGPLRRGVVSTASYEARVFGVRSAMPMAEAVRRCPDALVVPPRFDAYQEASRRVMEVMGHYSPLVEPLSLDEAFLDLTGTRSLLGPPAAAAAALKREVREATGGLTCSAGLASCKFVAKVASDLHKPDGLTVVAPGTEAAFLAPLAVERLWGVGPKTAARLRALGLATVGDIAARDAAWLARHLGSLGDHVARLSRGQDDRPVEPGHDRKSVGSEETYGEDVQGRDAVQELLRGHAEDVARHLRRQGLLARGVRVKVRYTEGFVLATRDGRLPAPCDDSRTLFEGARALLARLDLDHPIRLVGLAAFDLLEDGVAEGPDAAQADLFADALPGAAVDGRSRVEHAVDALRDRLGVDVARASRRPRDR